MNAETFYEEFKAALTYLGVSWGDKEQVAVCVDGSKFCMTKGRLSVSIEVGAPNDGR